MFFSPFCCTCILIEMSAYNLTQRKKVSGQSLNVFFAFQLYIYPHCHFAPQLLSERRCRGRASMFFLPFCSTCIHIEMSAHNLALRQTVSGQGFSLCCSPFSFICVLTEKVGPQSSLANDGFFLRPQEEHKGSLLSNTGAMLANEQSRPMHGYSVAHINFWLLKHCISEGSGLCNVVIGLQLGNYNRLRCMLGEHCV